MSTRFFGAPVKRNEDRKLLTGQALFIDDVELPGMLHVAFLRSQVAHARLKHIDVSRARQRPGVVAVYVAEDYGEYWQPGPLLVHLAYLVVLSLVGWVLAVWRLGKRLEV